DRIKDSPTDLVNSPAAIADFCHNASGAGNALFHSLTGFRTNQQGSVKTAHHLTTETSIAYRSAGRSRRSGGRLSLAQLLEAIRMPAMQAVIRDEISLKILRELCLGRGPMREGLSVCIKSHLRLVSVKILHTAG